MDGIATDVGKDVAKCIDQWARDGFPNHVDTLRIAGSYAIMSTCAERELTLEVLVPQSLIELMSRT